jgi:hypothetical protein
VWVEVRAERRRQDGQEEPVAERVSKRRRQGRNQTDRKGDGNEKGKLGEDERGPAVFMRWESGEGLWTRALPDRGDAKPSEANTYNQITI